MQPQRDAAPRRIRARGTPPAALLLALVSACGGAAPEAPPASPSGAVSAGTREATEAGLDVLSRGGNAVDAAVAVSLVLAVTEPSQSGLGGTAVVLFLPAGGEPVLIDAPQPAGTGAAGGGTAVALPATLRVLHHTWIRYGSGNMAWEELVEPAIRAASEGHTLGRFSHRAMVVHYSRIVRDPEARRLLLLPDRSIPSEASRVTNADLAAVLEQIATEGPEAFYTGEPGARWTVELARKGVPLPAEGLTGLPSVREQSALRGSYRGRTVWLAPAPYGGPFVLRALRFLELAPRVALETPGWSRTAWFAEALAYARSSGKGRADEHLASLPPMPLPFDGDETETLLRVADPDGPPRSGDNVVEAHEDAAPTGPPGDATTHFSILDGEGNAVSVTQTLGASFGSGQVAPGLGFFYADASAMASASLAPTLVVEDDRVALILGSPGGERGLAAVVQVLVRWADLAEPLESAVLAPRVYVADSAAGSRAVRVEPGRAFANRQRPPVRGRLILEGVLWADTQSVRNAATWGEEIDRLALERGFVIGERSQGPLAQGLDAWFGGVNAVARTGESWAAVGDERRDGIGGVLLDGARILQSGLGGVTSPPPAPDEEPPPSRTERWRRGMNGASTPDPAPSPDRPPEGP